MIETVTQLFPQARLVKSITCEGYAGLDAPGENTVEKGALCGYSFGYLLHEIPGDGRYGHQRHAHWRCRWRRGQVPGPARG